MKTLFKFMTFAILSIVISCNEDDIITDQNSTDKFVSTNNKLSARQGIPSINAFISSDTYLRHKNFIEANGQMDLDNMQYKKINVNEQNYDLFIIPITNENQIIAKLEVLDLKGTNYLPNNDKFALNYADLSNYDLNTDNGTIKLYDLNFDNFLHSQISVSNGIFTSYNSTGLSQDLKDKYSSVANKNPPQNVSCDGNGNGDVSFSECYKCISVAIQMNSLSISICEIFHVSGLPWWGSCEMSTAAACVVISATN